MVMRPHVIIHLAVSLDGRTTGFPIDLAAYYRLISHWNEDATLVGSDTILAAPDEIPPETEEDLRAPDRVDPGDSRPILVVPDSRGRVRSWHFWRKQPFWKDLLVLCAPSTPREYFKYLEARHIRYMVIGKHRVNLESALEILDKQYHVETVRVDSGGTLASILIQRGLADILSLVVHPVLVGPGKHTHFFRPNARLDTDHVIALQPVHHELIENGIFWTEYRIQRNLAQPRTEAED